jgi:hypothetical protein
MERNVQITFDTTTITDDEVRGIFALLDTVRPEAFDTAQVEQAVEEKLATEWTGVQITLRADTDEEVSREPIPIAEDPDDPKHLGIHPIVSIDANGLPWDERIHSGTKALNADGTWRTKRGVDKALVASVEAELRGAEDVDNADYSDEVTEPVAPPAPPAPPAPEAPLAPAVTESAPVAPSSSTSPFVALMKRVTTAQGAGKLTAQRVKELLESLDKKSIMDLRTDTDALDAFAVLLDGEGV